MVLVMCICLRRRWPIIDLAWIDWTHFKRKKVVNTKWTQKPKHRSNWYGVKDEHTPLNLPAMVARTHMHMARSAAADAPLCAAGCPNVAIAGIYSTKNCTTTDPSYHLLKLNKQHPSLHHLPDAAEAIPMSSGITWTHPVKSAAIIRTTTSLLWTSAQLLQVKSYNFQPLNPA